jgi:hypothetical protein
VRAFFDRGLTSLISNEDAPAATVVAAVAITEDVDTSKSQKDESVSLMRAEGSSLSLKTVVTYMRWDHPGKLVGRSIPVQIRFNR